MAGLKKPAKKKDTTNPNTTLVLFMVFFILLSIILGVMGYYGYDGQNKLKEDAVKAKKNEEAAKLGERYWAFVARDTRMALGFPLIDDPNELEAWKSDREELNNKFKGEKTKDLVEKMIAENLKELGEQDKKYATTYKDRLTKAAADLAAANANIAKLQGDLKKTRDDFLTLSTNQETYWKDAQARIAKGNKEALSASQKRSDETQEAFKQNQKLQEDIKKLIEDHQNKAEDFTRKIAKLEKEKERLQEKGDFRSNVRDGTTPHALLLDVSRGKTMWDDPLGKLVKVDMTNRLVHINLGSAQGIKPELTFMIFGSGWNQRAEKGLKGTIEVIRVLDRETSMARITSLYDSDGVEIALNDPSLGRVQREASNPMKEGDLLFNLTFGLRVAVAGIFNPNGLPGNSPLDQMRQLQSFAHLLERQGVVVDAYIDLMDGKIKGPGLTTRTRYLVIGDGLRTEDKEAPAKEKEEGKEEGKEKEAKGKEAKEKEAKEMPAKEADTGGNEERAQRLAGSIQTLKKEAVERGMFIISADNFLNIIGYRRPRSANDLEVSSFRPRAPAAGVAAPATAPAEKKGAEEK